ncbi:MAG: hypothetical protein ACREPR_01335 [Brasilonema sp.]
MPPINQISNIVEQAIIKDSWADMTDEQLILLAPSKPTFPK